LNDKQRCELVLLFSPKNNGQFNYFDFMLYFTKQASLKNLNQSIFSRSTYSIQSKVKENNKKKIFFLKYLNSFSNLGQIYQLILIVFLLEFVLK